MHTISYYRVFETAFGLAAIAFKDKPFALIEVKLPCDRPDTLWHPFEDHGYRPDTVHSLATAIADTLVGYFDGRTIDTPWNLMDLSRFTPSQQAIYRQVAAIPYGHTASYGQVAAMAGFPRAARFVGTTMAKNAYPVLIPCHRVIKSDGSIGGFGGGSHAIDLKRRMLALERRFV